MAQKWGFKLAIEMIFRNFTTFVQNFYKQITLDDMILFSKVEMTNS